jgi:hypothetical protein
MTATLPSGITYNEATFAYWVRADYFLTRVVGGWELIDMTTANWTAASAPKLLALPRSPSSSDTRPPGAAPNPGDTHPNENHDRYDHRPATSAAAIAAAGIAMGH